MKSSNDEPNEFLRSIFHAKHDRNMKEIDAQIAGLKTEEDINSTLAQINPENWQKVEKQEKPRIYRANRVKAFMVILVIILFLSLVLTIFGSLTCLSDSDNCKQKIYGTYTPTVVVPTAATLEPTLAPATPEPTAMPDMEIPTPVAILPSGYLQLPMVYPPLPVMADRVWMMDSSAATVEPPISNQDVWVKQNSSDPASGNRISYYTKVGNVKVTWTMDVPVEEGIYMVFVSDTLDMSAGGPHTFAMTLDETLVEPLRGTNTIIFNGKNGGQKADDWLSLGAYEVKTGQKICIQTSIGSVTETTPFALDRLLIVKLQPSQAEILKQLPEGRKMVSLIDSDQALYKNIYGGKPAAPEADSWFLVRDLQSWKGSFAIREKEWKLPVLVIWPASGRVTAGKYELLVHFPPEGTVSADFSLYADEKLVERPNPATVNLAEHLSSWYTLGTWDLPEEGAVSVWMTVPEGLTGKISADAVALLKVEE